MRHPFKSTKKKDTQKTLLGWLRGLNAAHALWIKFVPHDQNKAPHPPHSKKSVCLMIKTHLLTAPIQTQKKLSSKLFTALKTKPHNVLVQKKEQALTQLQLQKRVLLPGVFGQEVAEAEEVPHDAHQQPGAEEDGEEGAQGEAQQLRTAAPSCVF